jgi:hypothetical protein
MIIDNFVKIPSAALHFIATTKSTKKRIKNLSACSDQAIVRFSVHLELFTVLSD